MQEFNGEQLNKIDEIYDAVAVVVKLMMNAVPDWSIVTEIADEIAEFIHAKTGNPIYFPTATEDENGNRWITDYIFEKEV